MLDTKIELEKLLLAEFEVVENNIGIGKLIIDKDYNESLITNGKSLIVYSNLLLTESFISNEERVRVTNLSRRLIKQRVNVSPQAELYLTKENVEYLITYLETLKCNDALEVRYNSKSNRLLLTDSTSSIIKMLKLSFNDFKNEDVGIRVESNELLKILKLINREMMTNSKLLLTIQANNKPLILETYEVSACISCIK